MKIGSGIFLFLFLFSLTVFCEDITFNLNSDRGNTSMLNRQSIAGTIQFTEIGWTQDQSKYAFHFAPGSFNYGDRRKIGYYWNPGIQEFGSVNSSAKVTKAYFWSYNLSNGRIEGSGNTNPNFDAETGAITMHLDYVGRPGQAVWYYDDFFSPTYPFDWYNITYLGNSKGPSYRYTGENLTDSIHKTLDEAIALKHAYDVTEAVKYIMDNSDSFNVGIIARPLNGIGQFGYWAQETLDTSDGVQRKGWDLMLTIRYNGNAITAGGTSLATVYPPNTAVAQQPPVTRIQMGNQSLKNSNIKLEQNMPNPFVDGTSIRFHVNKHSQIQLNIYNIVGQRVINLAKSAVNGENVLFWDGKDENGYLVKAGVYFYRLRVDNSQMISKRMIVLR